MLAPVPGHRGSLACAGLSHSPPPRPRPCPAACWSFGFCVFLGSRKVTKHQLGCVGPEGQPWLPAFPLSQVKVRRGCLGRE